MPDLRSDKQKKLDAIFGMPLYYCSECMCGVKVRDGVIIRPCVDCKEAQVIAPRRAIAVGKGGASGRTKAKILLMKLMALLTHRSGVKNGRV